MVLFQGSFIANFLVSHFISVVELLLNFTAVEFVSLLDNVTFHLAKRNFAGRQCRIEAEIILSTKYKVPQDRAATPKRQGWTLFATIVALMSGWIVIYSGQLRGAYVPQTVILQLDDLLVPQLGGLSGVYELDRSRLSGFDFSRIRYVRSRGKASLGLCISEGMWTLRTSPGDACEDYFMRSTETSSFDILDTVDSQWYTTSGAGRFFPTELFVLVKGCSEDSDCGGYGRGICNRHRCNCEDGFYGQRCDMASDETCERLVVDESTSYFQGSRTFSSEYKLLRNGQGEIVKAYEHPIFVSEAKSGFDIILYTGLRWNIIHTSNGLVKSIVDSKEDLVSVFESEEYVFTASSELDVIEFASEPVVFNSPGDKERPSDLSWFTVRNNKLSAESDTNLICASCNNVWNPCQNGNQCIGGSCDCQNGARGSLCQITPLSVSWVLSFATIYRLPYSFSNTIAKPNRRTGNVMLSSIIQIMLSTAETVVRERAQARKSTSVDTHRSMGWTRRCI